MNSPILQTKHTSKNFLYPSFLRNQSDGTITHNNLVKVKEPKNKDGTQSTKGKTCFTASEISGPIPSPGKRVARITLEEESNEEKDRLKDEITLEELGLPRRRLRIWEPIFGRGTGDSRQIALNRKRRERERERFYLII